MRQPAQLKIRRLCTAFTLPFTLLFSAFAGVSAQAQALYTASRAGDLQIGLSYSSANANYEYVHNRIAGIGFYTDFDFKEHFGVDLTFHQLDDPNSAVYQRSYEVGGRYIRHYGNDRFNPYARISIGRGVQNFPDNVANLAYNLIAAAGGLDISLHKRVNLRIEYEYQDWLDAPGASLTLNPSMVTLGVAYHFSGGLPHR
jgi:opacity protein-like surface antigen